MCADLEIASEIASNISEMVSAAGQVFVGDADAQLRNLTLRLSRASTCTCTCTCACYMYMCMSVCM